jgi:hypothetical protein
MKLIIAFTLLLASWCTVAQNQSAKNDTIVFNGKRKFVATTSSSTGTQYFYYAVYSVSKGKYSNSFISFGADSTVATKLFFSSSSRGTRVTLSADSLFPGHQQQIDKVYKSIQESMKITLVKSPADTGFIEKVIAVKQTHHRRSMIK